MRDLVGLFLLLGTVAVAASLILGVMWTSGSFMRRGCEKIERREVRLYSGHVAIVDVCVGEWR